MSLQDRNRILCPINSGRRSNGQLRTLFRFWIVIRIWKDWCSLIVLLGVLASAAILIFWCADIWRTRPLSIGRKKPAILILHYSERHWNILKGWRMKSSCQRIFPCFWEKVNIWWRISQRWIICMDILKRPGLLGRNTISLVWPGSRSFQDIGLRQI